MTTPGPLAGRFEPGQVVVPIVDGVRLLGSAFFVRVSEEATWLMTARHVVEGVAAPSIAAMPTIPQGERRSIPIAHRGIVQTLFDSELDVALLRVPGPWSGAFVVSFGDHMHFNSTYLNPEWSQSRTAADGNLQLRLSTNQGHVLREEWSPDPRTGVEMRAMVLSWPAYRGASGSPVIDLGANGVGPGYLAGMVLNNIESELMPAHLEEIIDPDGRLERHLYFAPNGFAIAAPHLQRFVECSLR